MDKETTTKYIEYKRITFGSHDLCSDTVLNIIFTYCIDHGTKFDEAGKPIDGYSHCTKIEVMNKHDGNTSTSSIFNLGFDNFSRKIIDSVMDKNLK